MVFNAKKCLYLFGGLLSELKIPKYSVGQIVFVRNYKVRIDTVKQSKDNVYYGVTIIEPIGNIPSISVSEGVIDNVESESSRCS